MNLEVKAKVKGIGGRIATSLIIALVGVGGALLSQLGILLLPLLSALMVYLFVIERGEKRIGTFIAPLVVVIIDFLFNGLFSISAITSVLVALIVYFSLTKAILSKGECALAVTTLVSLSIGLMLIFAAMYEIGEPSFNGAIELYQSIIAQNREIFINSFADYIPEGTAPELEQMFSAEVLGALYDSYASILISFFVIFAFAITGFVFKLLAPVLDRSLVDPNEFRAWRFELSPIFAYFYLSLYLLGLFFGGADTLSIAILNLTNIFMFIFAYVGFGFALFILRRRIRSKGGALVVLILAMLVFYTLAINLLSFLGVFATIMLAKAKSEEQGSDDINS